MMSNRLLSKQLLSFENLHRYGENLNRILHLAKFLRCNRYVLISRLSYKHQSMWHQIGSQNDLMANCARI